MNQKNITFLCCTIGMMVNPLYAMQFSDKKEEEKQALKYFKIEQNSSQNNRITEEKSRETKELLEGHQPSIQKQEEFLSQYKLSIYALELELKERLFEHNPNIELPPGSACLIEQYKEELTQKNLHLTEEFRQFKELQLQGEILILNYRNRQKFWQEKQIEASYDFSLLNEKETELREEKNTLEYPLDSSALKKRSTTDEPSVSTHLHDETFLNKLLRTVKREFLPAVFTTAMSAIMCNEYTQYAQTPEMEFPMSIIPVSGIALMEMRNIADRFLSNAPSPWSFVPQSIQDVVKTGALLVPGAIAYAYSKAFPREFNDREFPTQVLQCVQSCLTE